MNLVQACEHPAASRDERAALARGSGFDHSESWIPVRRSGLFGCQRAPTDHIARCRAAGEGVEITCRAMRRPMELSLLSAPVTAVAVAGQVRYIDFSGICFVRLW